MGKILSLDIGEKRVGVAISDELAFLAHPLKTIEWKGVKHFLSQVKQLVQETHASQIVVGVPYTLRGTVSKKTQQILNIIEKLKKELNVPIIEVDESLSTRRAEDVLHKVGKKPSKHRDKIDQIAAVIILQDYLDILPKKGG